MAVLTGRVYFKNHGRLVSQLDRRVPRRVFAGATLEVLFSGEGLDSLDKATRTRLVSFAEDFLDCGCQGNPHCGHPERTFLEYILDLRGEGFSPEDIVEIMEADYHVTAYAGDVLTFLDEAVRHLDALEAIAVVEGASAARENAARHREKLERGA